MTNLPLTVREVFLTEDKRLPLDTFSKIESCEKLRRLKTRSPQLLKMSWSHALSEISNKAGEILDLSIPEMLVRAWQKYKILSEWTNNKKYPPGRINKVELISHTVKSVHHPRLEIMVNGLKTQEIDFEIELSLIIKAITLKLQDGRVKEISAGNCQGELKVWCEECLIIDRETRTIEFLKPVSLGEGLPFSSPRHGD